jgi:hypothetical protein
VPHGSGEAIELDDCKHVEAFRRRASAGSRSRARRRRVPRGLRTGRPAPLFAPPGAKEVVRGAPNGGGPQFFVRHAADRAQADRVWDDTRAFLESHSCRTCLDQVGERDRYGQETILVLLEAVGHPGLFYCCTENRGVIRDGPILTGDVVSIVDFDADPKDVAETEAKK